MAFDPAANVTVAALMLLVAFVPALAFTAGVRNLEWHRREPWGAVLTSFGWGAFGGVALTLIATPFLRPTGGAGFGPFEAALLATVFVAPVIEEVAKAVGLLFVQDDDAEPEDGLIYGAAVGFGFAATENLLYGLSALVTGGFMSYLATAAVRTVASSLLHASATAVVGYAVWCVRARHGKWPVVAAALGLAVVMHGLYNYVASQLLWLGLALAIALAWGLYGFLRRTVRRLDAQSALHFVHPPP